MVSVIPHGDHKPMVYENTTFKWSPLVTLSHSPLRGLLASADLKIILDAQSLS